jgi:hypothetical protein
MNAALMRLQLAQHWRSRRWVIALAITVAVVALGLLFSREKHTHFGYSILVAAIVALNFGIVEDRKQGFDRFLVNLFEPKVVFGHKIAATLISYCVFFAALFGLVAVLWLDVRAAAWYSAYWFFILGLILPIVLLVESAVDATTPAPFAMVLAIAVQIVPMRIWGVIPWLQMIGAQPTAGASEPLTRLALIVVGWNALLLPIAFAVYLLRHESWHAPRKGSARRA